MDWRHQTEDRKAERAGAAGESRSDDAHDGSSNSGAEESMPNSKLRDLRPEKDPMGAAKKPRRQKGA